MNAAFARQKVAYCELRRDPQIGQVVALVRRADDSVGKKREHDSLNAINRHKLLKVTLTPQPTL